MKRLTQTVLEIGLLGINKRRQPDAGAKVLTPAIKVQVIAGSRMRIVSAIEADDVVVLVLDPDPAEEPALAGVFLGCDIHDDAAYFAEKLAADETEIVIPALKILIHDHHLGKAQGQELHGIYVVQLAEHAFAEAGRRGRGESAVIGTLAHIQSAKEVHVADGDGSVDVFVFPKILEISFHQGMQLLQDR